MPFNRPRRFPFRYFLILLSLLYVFHPPSLEARTSPDIPVGSWVYGYFEGLEAQGLIKTGLLSTKPFSRIEGARLLEEALVVWNALPESQQKKMRSTRRMLKRLGREFRGDLTYHGYLKPLDTVYVKYLYSERTPDHLNTNNNGDILGEDHNLRSGISSALKLWDSLSFYIHPEYRGGEDLSEGKIIEGYGILNIRNLEIELGREPMWWGPGIHGDLLLTDNAKPFDMVRLTSQTPFLLPWVFSKIGPFKPTWFLTELEEDRDFPHAKLMGFRLDFRPRPSFRFALSRVIQFDGEGRKGLTAGDWIKILLADDKTEHSPGSGLDNNNIMSLDFSLAVNRLDSRPGWAFPFYGLKLYGEMGAEDSSGNGWPKERAYLAGVFISDPLFLDDTNLRVEWATTAENTKHGAWYTHGVYTSGYRYEGRIIGHHMGGDSEDLFARLEHFTPGGIRMGVETDIERRGVHDPDTDKRTWIGLDITYPVLESLDVSVGYGFENHDESSHSVWTEMRWDF